MSLAIVLAALGSGYWYRTRVEGRPLRGKLGEASEAYAERTPYRLLPWVR